MKKADFELISPSKEIIYNLFIFFVKYLHFSYITAFTKVHQLDKIPKIVYNNVRLDGSAFLETPAYTILLLSLPFIIGGFLLIRRRALKKLKRLR